MANYCYYKALVTCGLIAEILNMVYSSADLADYTERALKIC